MPHELEWLRYGDRFGFEAVFGRHPSPFEMRSMTICQNVINAKESHDASDNWAAWARDNPEMSELLNRAMLEAVRMGLIDGK